MNQSANPSIHPNLVIINYYNISETIFCTVWRFFYFFSRYMVVFLQNLTIYRENTRNKNCFIFTVNDQLLNYVTIILSNNFLLAVTTDSHSENSHNSQLYLSLPWKQEHCIGGSWRFYCTAFHRSFTSVCDGGLHNKGAAHLFLFSLTFFLMPMLRKCALGYFPDSLWLWEMAAGGRWDKQHPSSWGELWLAVNCLEDPDLRLK